MRYPLFLILSVFFALHCSSQEIHSSDLYIRTCVNETECSSANKLAWLFYDEGKNEFYIKIDLTSYKKSTDPAEEWLKDLSDSILYFKGFVPREFFPAPSNNISKSYQIKGQLFVNDVWRDQNVELTLFAIEGSPITSENRVGYYEQYKVNFGFAFSPREHGLSAKPHHLENPIFMAISLGKINLLQPGMEHFIREAYYHH